MDLSDYISLDFDRGELSFTFKSYKPEKNSRGRGLTSAQIKNEVLQSSRLRNLIGEVLEPIIMIFIEQYINNKVLN